MILQPISGIIRADYHTKKYWLVFKDVVQEVCYDLSTCTHQLLLWNNPVYAVQICHCDWFNKEADWPIGKQDKVRQKSQTTRMLGGRRVESGVARGSKKAGM